MPRKNAEADAAINEVPERNFRKSVRKHKKALIIAGATIGLVLLGTSVYFYVQYTSPEATAAREAARIEKENQEMLAELGTHLLLPQEEPVIYLIDNPEVLVENQAFFTGAEAGDYLLVYPTNAKAIIYSEKRDLIVNVGPVTFDASDSPVSEAVTEESPEDDDVSDETEVSDE